MQKTLIFKIDCGEKTCASEPGKFCEHLRWNAASGKASCHFFGPVWDVDGWIQRHQDCFKYEVQQEKKDAL